MKEKKRKEKKRKEKKRKEKKRKEKKRKEKKRTRRLKEVPFHNRAHRTFLLFACVETPHSDLNQSLEKNWKRTGKPNEHAKTMTMTMTMTHSDEVPHRDGPADLSGGGGQYPRQKRIWHIFHACWNCRLCAPLSGRRQKVFSHGPSKIERSFAALSSRILLFSYKGRGILRLSFVLNLLV